MLAPWPADNPPSPIPSTSSPDSSETPSLESLAEPESGHEASGPHHQTPIERISIAHPSSCVFLCIFSLRS